MLKGRVGTLRQETGGSRTSAGGPMDAYTTGENCETGTLLDFAWYLEMPTADQESCR